MAQGFYTLDEAAQRLGLAPHELNQMVQRREVRGFQDRGTWRFRSQDIEELARQRGRASDPDLQLGDSKAPTDPPKKTAADVFPFELDKGGESDFGTDIFSVAAEPVKGPPGSDSDVRLVSEGSKLDLKAVTPKPLESKPTSSGKLIPDSDSDVKLVDMSGSDVVPIGSEDRPASDSDVRLDGGGSKQGHDSGVRIGSRTSQAPSDETLLIGEINLEPLPSKSGLRKGHKSAALDRTEGLDDGKKKKGKGTSLADSSDIELTPAHEKKPSSSLFDSSQQELTLDSSGELNVAKGPTSSAKRKADSGRQFGQPSDSGISLEDSGKDEIDFELSVEESGHGGKAPISGPKTKSDSSSEFELTLDDEGLAPLEEENSDTELLSTNLSLAPKSDKGKAKPPAKKKEEDSELEISLDDSATDLESSDFELALDDETATEGDEVMIDEDVGEADETAVRPMLDDEGVDELLIEEDEGLVIDEAAEEEDEEAATQQALASIAAANAAPPSWGAWSLLHVPTAFFMVVVGFLLYEMMRSIIAYNQPNQPAGMVFDITKDVAKKLGLI